MISVLFDLLGIHLTNIISQVGYLGIIFLMTLESACMPVPSEIVMPFGGFAAQRGDLDFFLVGMAGSVGCLIGSVLSYAVGYYGGRPVLEKYGKYVLISSDKMHIADAWFEKYGGKAVFIARLLPIIRTFISLPAGVARMDFKKFAVYSFVGSIPWCYALAYAGVVLGENWTVLEDYWIYLDILTILGAIGFLAYTGYKLFGKKSRVAKPIPVMDRD